MSYIYVIGTDEQVKVGFSKNPENRLKQLQTGNMNRLTLFYKEEIQDSKVKIVEKLIHRDMKQKYKKVGEWFDASPTDAIDYLKFAKIRYDSDDSLECCWKYGLRIL